MEKKQETIATYNFSATQMAEKFRGIGALVRLPDLEKGFELAEGVGRLQ